MAWKTNRPKISQHKWRSLHIFMEQKQVRPLPQTPSDWESQPLSVFLGSPDPCQKLPWERWSSRSFPGRWCSPGSSEPFRLRHISLLKWWLKQRQRRHAEWLNFSVPGSQHVMEEFVCTFFNTVADGLCAECVVQRDCNQAVCVTGQLWNRPLWQKQSRWVWLI